MLYKEMKKERLRTCKAIISDDRRGFFTILDNLLTVGKFVGGKEQTGRLQPRSGGLLEGAVGGMSLCHKCFVLHPGGGVGVEIA